MDMLLGVVLRSIAVPPVMEKEKSLTSRAPVPLFELSTASEKVTAKVLLSEANATDEIIGTIFSFNSTVLLLWDVLASLPAAS